MASTLTIDTADGRYVQGSRLVRKGSGNLGTYATGGIAITAAQLEFPGTIGDFEVSGNPSGYNFEWDKTNSKIKASAAVRTYTATFDAASLGATTSRDDSITFTGVVSTDIVLAVIPPPAAAASVVVQACRVSATDTIIARLTNASAGAVDLASGTWTAVVVGANGQAKEIANAIDLSGVTFRFISSGY